MAPVGEGGDTVGGGGGDTGGSMGSSSLKETFEMYRTEHQREHANVAAANEVRMKEHQHAHDREHQMREEQLRERESRLDVRLATMNEFRGALSDLSAKMATKEYVEAKLDGISQKIEQASKNEGDRLKKIEEELAAQRGTRGGSAAAISYIVLAIGALAGLIGLFTFFAGQ